MKAGRVFFVLVIGFVFVYIIYSMMKFNDGNNERQADSIRKIIDKALVQCYALEGSYPVDVEYVSKYGVIFDNNHYIYFYEWYGSNIKPSIKVLDKGF